MVGKYFLAFCRLPLLSVDYFLCRAEAFEFDAVTLNSLLLWPTSNYDWYHIHEIVAKTNVIKRLPLTF